MKTERLWIVEHRQAGDEGANLLELLDTRDLVVGVELELVVEDCVREIDLQNDTSSFKHEVNFVL